MNSSRRERYIINRRERQSKSRQSTFINEYIQHKYFAIYREAAQFYNRLNTLYPTKRDLRKCNEFKRWKMNLNSVSEPSIQLVQYCTRNVVRSTRYNIQAHANIPLDCETTVHPESPAEQSFDPTTVHSESPAEQSFDPTTVHPESPAEQSFDPTTVHPESPAEQSFDPTTVHPESPAEQSFDPTTVHPESPAEQSFDPTTVHPESPAEQSFDPTTVHSESPAEQSFDPTTVHPESPAEQSFDPTTVHPESPTVQQGKKIMQLNIPLLEPSVITQTLQIVTQETLQEEGNPLQVAAEEIVPLYPSLTEEIPGEIIDRIIGELREDPELKNIMTDIEQTMEFEQLGMDLELPEDRLENELNNVFW